MHVAQAPLQAPKDHRAKELFGLPGNFVVKRLHAPATGAAT